ncbi:MAG: hypothetical protein ACLU3F_00300 [Blautia wexlerae]
MEMLPARSQKRCQKFLIKTFFLVVVRPDPVAVHCIPYSMSSVENSMLVMAAEDLCLGFGGRVVCQ